jgi:uncharacterized LabA/DUF88 family protein
MLPVPSPGGGANAHLLSGQHPTANFYVDGFNLYNGCLKSSPYKWLDLEALCRQLAPNSTLNRVRYFTARVHGAKALRQQVYLEALAACPAVAIHTEGHFTVHTVTRPIANTPADGMATVLEYQSGGSWHALPKPKAGCWLRASVRDVKEKGTDVNLATLLLVDAYEAVAAEAYVISGDSDLEMPIRIANSKMPVTVINPVFGRRSKELQAASHRYTTLNSTVLARSQLPQTVVHPSGKRLTKPATW